MRTCHPGHYTIIAYRPNSETTTIQCSWREFPAVDFTNKTPLANEMQVSTGKVHHNWFLDHRGSFCFFFFSVLFLTMKLWSRWISPLEDTSCFLLFLMSPKKKWVKSPAGWTEGLRRHWIFQNFLKQATNQPNWFQLWADVSLGSHLLRQADWVKF